MSGSRVSRKRDGFRRLFGGSRTQAVGPTLPTAPSISPNVVQSQAIPPSHSGSKLLADALSSLEPKERETIEKYGVHGATDINAAVDQSYGAALRQKQACEDKSWRWTFRGRTVVLRDEADKVLRWLDRFKSVGDVIANVDPVHIGLPWAGIRILLEMVGAESHQMAALLIGMSLSMAMASRLRVYFDYLDHLPATLATDNFEKALVKMYVHVLRFIATAIQTYEIGLATRVVQALWQTSSLEQFEAECDKLAQRAEIEASNCDRDMSEQDRKDAQRWRDEMRNILKGIDQIQGINDSLLRMHIKVDLAKLITARGATYNSSAEEGFAHCLPGTRVQLLDQITGWADDATGKYIFWLCGKAGTGKSTISRTIASRLDKQQRLGASFFFKRGEGDRGNASRFFSTIAAQLADRIPGFSPLIAEALEKDFFLSSSGLQDQFEKLLSQPLVDLRQGQTTLLPLFVVIDALDECEPDTSIRTILSLLAQIEAIASVRLRIFVTSRPELPLKLGFGSMSGSLHEDMILEEVQATTIEHDIRLYFQHRFKEIKLEDAARQPFDPLPVDWPGNDNVTTLVKLAIPLFIFAFTVCRYVAESDPQGHLDSILQQKQSMSLSGLEKTYLPILNQLIVGCTSRQQDQIMTNFREIVGSIVLLATPLSVSSLSRLLEVSPRVIGERLSKLHSVLNIPTDREEPIRLFHLSFRDFLVDEENKEHNCFWVDESEMHGKLAHKCLLLLSRPTVLKKDLCNVEKPGHRRHDVSEQTVSSCIAPDTAYACSYWVWHLSNSRESISDGGDVHVFLQTHFLHWLEALSWLGRISQIIAHVSTIRSLVHNERGPQLLLFLDDVKRFVLRNRHVIDLAPLQLYSSALLFSPTQSIIRQAYEMQHDIPWLSLRPNVPASWSAEMQKLEGHASPVTAVAFCSDGQALASAASDTTVRIWSAVTGEMIQKFDYLEEIRSFSRVFRDMAFSHDGQVVASTFDDHFVHLGHVATGERQKLEGHEKVVSAVTFCPVELVLASASQDGTIRLWDLAKGEARLKLVIAYDGPLGSIAFSPDGQVLASGSSDTTVQLWDTATGKIIRKLTGHDGGVTAVAFSPDRHAQVLASVSEEGTIQLWDTATGELMRKLECFRPSAKDVVFSPDGQVLVIACNEAVRLWGTATGEEMDQLDVHDSRVHAVAFSPDGHIIASASSDGMIRLWNATARVKQNVEEHFSRVLAMALSPDGHMLASASEDWTVRLWDVATGKTMHTLEGHYRWIKAIVFSRDGQMLASAAEDAAVCLWETATGMLMQRFEWHDGGVTAIDFSPDGQWLASADNTVHLWSTATGDVICKLEGHVRCVRVVLFSPDGQMLASADNDGAVRLWNLATGEVLELQSCTLGMRSLVFSPDGEVLACSNWESVQLWNTTTGRKIHNFKSHCLPFDVLAFSPDGKFFAAGCFHRIVCLWNAKTGEEMQQLKTSKTAKKLVFSKDSKVLLTDVGRFDMTQLLSDGSAEETSTDLTLQTEWIQWLGQDLLWLPHEHRGSRAISHKNTLMIGQYSGGVSFFRYGPP